MITRLFERWLKPREPPAVTDSLLGELTYRAHGWCGRLTHGEGTLGVVVQGSRGGPPQEVIAVAHGLLAELDQLEAMARGYLLEQGAVSPAEAARLELSGVEAFYPHEDWLRRVRAAYPADAPTIEWEGPMGLLELGLPADGNVFDVVFSGETPIAGDYH